MCLCQIDQTNQLTTLWVITLSSFDCIYRTSCSVLKGEDDIHNWEGCLKSNKVKNRFNRVILNPLKRSLVVVEKDYYNNAEGKLSVMRVHYGSVFCFLKRFFKQKQLLLCTLKRRNDSERKALFHLKYWLVSFLSYPNIQKTQLIQAQGFPLLLFSNHKWNK